MRSKCPTPRRRGGRWVCESEPLDGEAVRRLLARAGKGSMKAIRRGGRWIPHDRPHHDPYRVLKGLLSHAWILAAPLLGMAWVNNAYVRPDVAAMEAVGSAEIQRALDRRDVLRAQVAAVQGETELVLAEVDTLTLPLVVMRQTVLDSLSQRGRGRLSDPGRLQARIDSLRTLCDYLALDIQEARRSQAAQRALLANLQGWQQALGDSLAGLESGLAASTAEWERATQRQELHAFWPRLWYLFGPVLGVLWTQES